MCSKLLADTQGSLPKDVKEKSVVGRFLENYMLGLMASLADVINDRLSSSAPVEEQKRCLRAMEEMIKVCRTYVRLARPQVSDCPASKIC
jgi:serine/threonine-protein kinase ATR